MNDLVDQIVSFESGELDPDESLQLFAELIRNGMAWRLQGFYGRQAQDLIDNGYISPEGEVLK